MRLDDYERLEFLGDSVLNYLIAKFFFLSTQYDQERKMPKELHKMKTAVINNTLLSLIVIEYGIYEHIIYNKKAVAFKEQFEKYVKDVDEMVSQRGTTSEIADQLKMFEVDRDQIFDLDSLYESGLKIFGDVFESLIGAVFLDCNDID
jgi:dsRNA-specific ribonuclease